MDKIINMKINFFLLSLLGIVLFANCVDSTKTVNKSSPQKKIESGIIEGIFDSTTNVEKYLGIPYAKPPVGELRWRRPIPVESWEGIKHTQTFSNWAMQYKFASWVDIDEEKLSEDCLYLNVWTPATRNNKKLPVVVKIHGGGLMVGAANFDLSDMASKGVVVVSLNYRLNIFGFFAHPELSKEDIYGTSGNYGFLDQLLALQWVKQNISAFGGDPERITIEGESAGAISVNAHMASPLSKGLIKGAIATSGGLVRPMPTLEEAEIHGKSAAEEEGYLSLKELRATSAEEIMEIYKKGEAQAYWPIIDGHFLHTNIPEVIQKKEQAQIPLMIGWNSAEVSPRRIMKSDELTKANFIKRIKERFPENADTILMMFNHKNPVEIERSAVDLGSIDFQDYNAWKWFDLHQENSNQPVYRFLFSRVVPPPRTVKLETYKPPLGARHAEEIPYAWGSLAYDSETDYQEVDYQISDLLNNYYFNFIRSGNPNGKDLPKWPSVEKNSEEQLIMNFDIESKLEKAENDYRYRYFDRIYQQDTHWVK